jgi:diguanylate cyclase (GGDEF)-like protein
LYQLRTLGALRLTGPSGELLAGRRRELSLLAYLRRAPGGCTRAELASLLWGDRSEERARHSLRQALLELRRATDGVLQVGEEEVRVAPGGIGLDVEGFEASLREGDMAGALALWAGDFLAPVEGLGAEPFRAWVEGERARLRRLLRSALDEWTSQAERGGDWPGAVGRGERWTALFPVDAVAEGRHVEALHRSGRTDEALARHAAFTARQAAWGGGELPVGWAALRRRLEQERGDRLRGRPRVGSTAVFVPDLVGRGPALAELRAAWERVRAGGTELVRVGGEEGSGKTRLLEEFARALAAEGEEAVVLRARAYPTAAGESWSTARELLAPLRGAPGLGGASSGALAELGELVPGVAERFRGLPPPSRGARAVEDGVLEVLRSVSEEASVALLVDDLVAADEESFGLLQGLVRRLPGAGVLVVFTVRTGDRAAEQRGAALQELPVTRRVDLAPLSPEDVAAMLGSMLHLPIEPRRRLALSLHAETAGNPLYVYELTAALVEEGRLLPDGSGRWEVALPLNAPLPLPTGIREIVARRLARLSPAARELLGAAAVLGERFDLRRLDAVGALPPEALSAALDELLARRLIRELPGGAGSYVFTHALTRRVAYDRLLPGRRDALLALPAGERLPWYRQLWRPPEAVFLDAGAEGEWLAARLRLVVMGLLLVLPVANLVDEPSYRPYQTGFAVSLVAVAVAVAIYVALRRGGYRPWMGFVSTVADVSLVTLGLASFALVGEPHAAVNSKPVFETYFLAIFGSSLRYDRRICIVAGATAILEYALLVLAVTSRWELNAPEFSPFPYGMFSWVAQGARLILFLAAAMLSWELVRRAQELRDQATRDQGTGLWSRALLQRRASAELTRARRFGYDVSLALAKVDGLARLVEHGGPADADELLRSLARVLRSALREEDVLARHSPGEIAVLLPGVDLPTSTRKMEALREELEDVLRGASAGLSGRLELRLGVAAFPSDGDGLESLLRQAEARAGRDRRAPAPVPA